MTESLTLQARRIQGIIGNYLYGGAVSYTDVEQWKEVQQLLMRSISEMLQAAPECPEEEAEVLLAVLMAGSVAMRYPDYMDEVLQRAEKVLPNLQDKVLKCHLMVFCYGECPDELLADDVYRLMDELKDEGKEEEIRVVMELMENLVESQL